jgi:predicted PhzF superfamily epimerase YddE/YHI9
VRAFFPKDGTLVEDPVTGSLNASLAEWLLRRVRASVPSWRARVRRWGARDG